eukprot:SAG31_NODE_13510_length_864_cov_1.380392_2_plen_170_part_00
MNSPGQRTIENEPIRVGRAALPLRVHFHQLPQGGLALDFEEHFGAVLRPERAPFARASEWAGAVLEAAQLIPINPNNAVADRGPICRLLCCARAGGRVARTCPRTLMLTMFGSFAPSCAVPRSKRGRQKCQKLKGGWCPKIQNGDTRSIINYRESGVPNCSVRSSAPPA